MARGLACSCTRPAICARDFATGRRASEAEAQACDQTRGGQAGARRQASLACGRCRGRGWLGQYGMWGAYTASPGGKKVCFALAKPTASETNPTNRPRNPVYMFISTRPADKVTNEISLVVGYPFKPGTEATAQVGGSNFALYTQQDGAWIKNATEEAKMVDAMRGGDNAVIKGVSAKGTQSTDTFSLKGVAQALDRTAQECK